MIDYTKFLAKTDETRFYLQKPFLVDGGAAFCNGHMFVFVEGAKPRDPGEAPSSAVSNVNKWVKGAGGASEYHPLPLIDWTQFACTNCNGTGQSENCPECEGSGTVMLHNDFSGYQVECRTCRGEDSHECILCGGHGTNGLAMLNGVVGALPAYLKMISELPCVGVARPESSSNMIQFRFDGGCGAFMPLRVFHDDKPILITLEEPAQ